jgi:hypothetical protein
MRYRNIICSNLDLGGGVYGTNATTGAFCITEGGAVAKDGRLGSLERYWPISWRACRIGAWCCFVKWRNCSSKSSAFPLRAYAA